jgi:hypothetical protein
MHSSDWKILREEAKWGKMKLDLGEDKCENGK